MMVACTIAIIAAIVLTGVMVRAGLDRIAEAIEAQEDDEASGEDPGARLQRLLNEVQGARFGQDMIALRGNTKRV